MHHVRPITVIGLSGWSVSLRVPDFARVGETIFSDDILIESGGKGFNQAIGCTRFGIDTTFISVIGEDDPGRECRRVLEGEK